jgi:hypothetical protein
MNSVKLADQYVEHIEDYKGCGIYKTDAVIVLAITKFDLCYKSKITKKEIDALVRKYDNLALMYVETSARQSDVGKLFNTAIQLISDTRSPKNVEAKVANETTRCVIS